jgi:hypothetical protein
MDIEKILEEYRNGDEGMRLRLFFAFRDLRDHFSDIEHESRHDEFTFMGFSWMGKQDVSRAA